MPFSKQSRTACVILSPFLGTGTCAAENGVCQYNYRLKVLLVGCVLAIQQAE